MDERYICNDCGAEFTEAERFTIAEDGYIESVAYVCPLCRSVNIDEMTPCWTCDGGWVRPGRHVCPKCEKRLEGKLGRFLRGLTAEEVEALDDMVEGRSLREWR